MEEINLRPIGDRRDGQRGDARDGRISDNTDDTVISVTVLRYRYIRFYYHFYKLKEIPEYRLTDLLKLVTYLFH